MIRPALTLLIFLLCFPVLGLAQGVTLTEALGAASSRPTTVSANLELLQAQSDLLRTGGDPLAIRVDLTRAEHAVALKTVKYQYAYYGALLEIGKAYTEVLDANAGLNLANLALEVRTENVRITEIRVNNGSVTRLELQEARVEQEKAQKEVLAAGSTLNVASNNLEGMIGREVEASELEAVPETYLLALPALENALSAVSNNPQLVETQQGLELAGIGVETLDPSYASSAQIEGARTQLQTAEKLVVEAKRGFDLQARNAFVQAENANKTLSVEAEALRNAGQRYSTTQDRLKAGLIAGNEVKQAEVTLKEAELSFLRANHAYFVALLELQQTSMLDLGFATPENASTLVKEASHE